MPDAFFQKKRKRTAAAAAPSTSSRAGPSRSKPSSSTRMRKPAASDSSDDDNAVPAGGIDDMDLVHRYDQGANSDDEAEAAETPAEARVRLAKMYLQGLSSTPAGGDEGDDFFEPHETPSFGLADAAQADKDNIAARLQKDVAEQSGKIHLFLAQRLVAPSAHDTDSILAVRGHRLSVTSAVASTDAKWLFTASKDGTIVRWRLRDGKMMRILPKRAVHLDDAGAPLPRTAAHKSKTSGAARRRARLSASADKGKSRDAMYVPVGADQGHTDEIWSLSLSSDNTFLASGGKDRSVCIWRSSPTAEAPLKNLQGHKDAITALAFRSGAHELYTASLDRTLKLYDVAQLSYIETLFGHQESILSLSCLAAETAVSAGGRDRTCRYWKIRDESQLVFRAGIRSRLRDVLEGGDLAAHTPTEALEGSVEAVAMLDTHHFVSGGDSGSIALWNLGRKKPVFSVAVAHGFEVTHSASEGEVSTPRWITSLAALPYGDVFASGSWDGCVRVWALQLAAGGVKGFSALFALPAHGVVNALQIIQPPLNTLSLDNDGEVHSTAVRPKEWRRRGGLASPSSTAPPEPNVDGKPLTRLQHTKQNAPPIVVAAVGKEHKFGRWVHVDGAKNGTLVMPLRLKCDEGAQGSGATDGDKFRLV
ncbi:related to RRP9-protein associated with the U3 small nucleolar RNA [Sporisorium reilianum SRZ2]|uniref:Related to RRP9-protein associated with the U3 small nucleolar RNA n=1 Tax=Sporisorium reilianum (strain SRZ2) TaxID=999809 RepID=E6ZQ44_SPORE|nr:related to RRP9-protein associated with the U3 small nucleolar RNA [Sporisorium reilianum SRZ2]